MIINIFICPICSSELIIHQQTYICAENHTFDLSKEGYLNLLLVNQKSSNTPGDDIDMVNARRNFLEQNHYLQLSDQLNIMVKNNLKSKPDNSYTILDCGCGEGYYTNKLQQYLKEQQPNKNFEVIGLDVSKDTIKLAAKKYSQSHFIISNIHYSLPFKNNSIDLLINVFAPKNPEEFSRILIKNGILLVIFPSNNHLRKLKEQLKITLDYGQKPDEVMKSFSKDFKLIDTKQIEQVINLKAEDATELIKMTPLYWQIDHQKLEGIKSITTEIGFNMYVFKKIK